jgi:hypothetical protein
MVTFIIITSTKASSAGDLELKYAHHRRRRSCTSSLLLMHAYATILRVRIDTHSLSLTHTHTHTRPPTQQVDIPCIAVGAMMCVTWRLPWMLFRLYHAFKGAVFDRSAESRKLDYATMPGKFGADQNVS